MAAGPESVEVGWDLFKDSDYAATLGEINDGLAQRGLGPVSLRMYQHYNKLHRYGVEAYVPINRFDVRTLQNPVWDQVARAKFPLYERDLAVLLRLLVDGSVRAFIGRLRRLSDAEAVVELHGSDSLAFFDDLPRTEVVCELVFLDSGEVHLGWVERFSFVRDARLTTLRVSFASLTPAERLLGHDRPGETRLRLRTGVNGAPEYLGQVAHQLYWATRMIEAARSAESAYLRTFDPDGRVVIPSPLVLRLAVSSPLLLEVGVVAGVAAGVATAVKQIVAVRTEWLAGTEKRSAITAQEATAARELESAGAERERAERERQTAAAETARQREADARRELTEEATELLRWERNRREAIAELQDELLHELFEQDARVLAGDYSGAKDERKAVAAERVETLIRQELLPAALEFVESAGGDVAVETPIAAQEDADLGN